MLVFGFVFAELPGGNPPESENPSRKNIPLHALGVWTGPADKHQAHGETHHTPGFHNFNLRIFNLRVSNPNKFIVDGCLTRCRISMRQGLGPKKHGEISEIDCTYIIHTSSTWCRRPPGSDDSTCIVSRRAIR